MSDRDDALVEVVDLVKRHGLTLDEIASALAGDPFFVARRSGSLVARIFGYIGGTFVFAGLAIYVGMRWDDLGSLGRVLLTLGPGFSTFVLALVCTTDEGFERAATPLFLLSALLQPAGILVMLQEYSTGGDPMFGVLLMNLVMVIQQGCAFWARRRTVLALTTIVFATGFSLAAFDLLDVGTDLVGMVMGVSLGCVGWALDRSPHKPLSGLLYFIGATAFLAAAYDTVRRTPIEPVFVALACGVIFLSTVARSRSLLFVGTLALIAYIGDFINEHFSNSLAAPVLLMVFGFLLIGVGAAAVRLHNRYIKADPGASA
jgi:Predicted membrane protein (DUF2157)